MRDLLPFFVVLSHCAALARLFGMRATFKYLHEPKSRIIYFIKKVFMQFFFKDILPYKIFGNWWQNEYCKILIK